MGKEIVLAEKELAEVMGDVSPEVEDPQEVQRMIAARIISATDISGLFVDTSTIATKDAIGWPLIVTDCRLMKGEIEGEEGVYMIIEATRQDTGEVIVLNSGSPNIMSILYRGKKLGVLPLNVEVAEAGKAKPGWNAPLTLRARGDTLRAIAAARAQ